MLSAVHGCGWYTATDVRTFPLLEHVLPLQSLDQKQERLFLFLFQ